MKLFFRLSRTVKLLNPIWLLGYIVIRKPKLIKNDRLYIKLVFYYTFNRWPNLDQPLTYNEKLNWLKLHEINPKFGCYVDKYEVKKVVRELMGEDMRLEIIPTLGVWEKFDEIDFEKLPNEFVLKCTHDSGGLIICRDKSKFDKNAAKIKVEKSLKNEYFYRYREYPYKYVKPRIIVEQYIAGKNLLEKSDLIDYKIYCCEGEPICILVCIGRSVKVKYYYYSSDWTFLEWDKVTAYEDEGKTLPKPNNLDEMLDIARKLSKGIHTVRVDLYNINGKIYFGELTFFSNSGFDRDITKECDEILGAKVFVP